MKTVRIKKRFPYAHDGCRIVHYEPGVQDVEDRVAEVALAEGWAEPAAARAKGKGDDDDPYAAVHRGGGKWAVTGPDGVVEAGLDKETAARIAADLNAEARVR